jgi:hypothetical protein
VIVVVGSRHDEAAREIVSRWAAHDAALLSCEDLSAAGWRHLLFDPSRSRAVVSGRVVPERDIRGVIVRRPWILEQELVHIAADDREYVAAEMNAFLVSWLSHLSCRVLNRPAGASLCGPNWRRQQWALAAGMAGMIVGPMRWEVPVADRPGADLGTIESTKPTRLVVLGDQCIGAYDEGIGQAARRLALIAGTDLLSVELSNGGTAARFLDANPMPGIGEPAVADAVLGYLLSN